MTIRVRLIVQTVLLQVVSLLFLACGVLVVQRVLGDRELRTAEALLRHSVARTATDALIQKDEVQLLSYLNFLKVQHPELSYARVIWRKGGKASSQNLGSVEPGALVVERRVVVSDPASLERTVEISYGVDEGALRAPARERTRLMMKVLVLAGAATALLGLLMAILLSQTLTKRLGALSKMAQEVGSGRFGVHLEWESRDEIGALVQVFNRMSSHLADLDVAKKNFVSSVTHELRSPLGAIESFLPLIREKVSSGEKPGLGVSLEYLDRVAANVLRLNRFITDLLDVAKIEQGKMECVLRPLELSPLVAEVSKFFEAKARAQSVLLENHINGAPPVLADGDRVRQVLVNLIANALKFTPPGGTVTLSAELVRDAAGRWLEISVTDTGRGMDAKDRERLFKPFSQGANINEGVAGHRGTGLGLYIVKSIIDQHGGRVEVRSEPGEGSRFLFSLRTVG